LPGYVEQVFEDYLKCGRLEQRFLRVRCDRCHAEHLVAFSRPLLRILAPAALVIPSRH
jgi:ribosomal protein S27E